MDSKTFAPSDEMRRYYDEMSRVRRRIVLPLAIVSGGYYLLMNALANFTSLLDGIPVAGLSWAYIFGFSQMLVSAVVVLIYRSQVRAVDRKYRPEDAADLTDEPATTSKEATS